MFGDLQQWLILLIMMVPGFIVTYIQRGFRPKRFTTQFGWLANSILWGVSLNAIMVTLIVLTTTDYRVLTIADVGSQFQDLKIAWLVYYFIVLYSLSTICGIIIGRWPVLGLRPILNRFKITPYGEQSSVWSGIFEIEVPTDKKATWVRISLGEGATVFGRLRYVNERVLQDKPIEVYVSPCYELTADEGWKRTALPHRDEKSDGMYLKITDKQSVQFFFKEESWAFLGD